jgi:hypothetical protein
LLKVYPYTIIAPCPPVINAAVRLLMPVFTLAVMSPQSAYTPLRFKYAFDEKRVFLAGESLRTSARPTLNLLLLSTTM